MYRSFSLQARLCTGRRLLCPRLSCLASLRVSVELPVLCDRQGVCLLDQAHSLQGSRAAGPRPRCSCSTRLERDHPCADPAPWLGGMVCCTGADKPHKTTDNAVGCLPTVPPGDCSASLLPCQPTAVPPSPWSSSRQTPPGLGHAAPRPPRASPPDLPTRRDALGRPVCGA